jgi:hypothetical protein
LQHHGESRGAANLVLDDVARNLQGKRERESHRAGYCVARTVSGGKLVVRSKGDGPVGAFCINPGMKKLAGETLGESLSPPQPTVMPASIAAMARCLRKRSNVIVINIEDARTFATTNFHHFSPCSAYSKRLFGKSQTGVAADVSRRRLPDFPFASARTHVRGYESINKL